MKNWKTTSAGIVAIVVAGFGLYNAYVDGLTAETLTTNLTALLAGIGLVFANDGSTPESK